MTFYTLAEAAKTLKCSERSVQRAAIRIKKPKGALRLARFTEAELMLMAGCRQGGR